jgi:tRNA dimethylallyltransferase
VAIVGPTGSGKSRLAMAMAAPIGAEILSVDSMQVYRGMDIGTAKPTVEERNRVRHHMIDIVPPEEPYTVAQFRPDARRALVSTDPPVVLIVGGSGLHFRSVVDPMRFRPSDPHLREELEQADLEELVAELRAADAYSDEILDLANPRRVVRAVEAWRVAGITPTEWAETPANKEYGEYRPELEFVGVALDRADIEVSIRHRLRQMREAGFLAEVESLAPRLGPTASQAVGYRELLEVVSGRLTEGEGFAAVERATLRLVKRQRTFFRRDPRLRWFDADQEDLVDAVMKEAGL